VIDDITNNIEYCISIILRGAKLEDRLVRQLLYTMLSAYTQNPMNLWMVVVGPTTMKPTAAIHSAGGR
jgi:hypothetical protein